MKMPACGWYPRAGRTSVVGPRDALTMSMGQVTDGGKRRRRERGSRKTSPSLAVMTAIARALGSSHAEG